eukprot:350189-Chlamydomonas_euryale.AAC.2
MVRLRGLRHPLLQADFLKNRRRLEVAAASEGAGASGRKRNRMLSTRREAMLDAAGVAATPGGGDGSSGSGGTAAAELASLQSPRPVDLLVRSDVSAVVITGPNTGGKTATMKALGLCAVMARCGLPLPADAPAMLPAFSSVLADIGDEQSLTANLSTFSGHLKRIQVWRGQGVNFDRCGVDRVAISTDVVWTGWQFRQVWCGQGGNFDRVAVRMKRCFQGGSGGVDGVDGVAMEGGLTAKGGGKGIETSPP